MPPKALRSVHFAIPGALDSPTGGYGYDRALIAHLPALGWQARHLPLPAGFPLPSAQALAAAEAAFAALPDGAVVLADGLAFGALPETAARHGNRLRLVALVHHPLAEETGLAPATAARLAEAERAALSHTAAVLCTSTATAARLVTGYGVPPARLHVAEPGIALPAAPVRPAPPAAAWSALSSSPPAGGSGHPAPAVAPTGGGDARPGAVPRLLSVGSLTRRKGHDLLIAALAGLADLPWQARIVGPAPDALLRQRLQAQIAAAGLGARITLVGPVPDIAAEYAAADLFALATRHEGYGMAYAEALAHGLPVIATATGPVPGFVPPEAGRLVPPEDLPALRAALAALLGDASARAAAARAARAAAARLPRWEDTAAIVARVLSGVAA